VRHSSPKTKEGFPTEGRLYKGRRWGKGGNTFLAGSSTRRKKGSEEAKKRRTVTERKKRAGFCSQGNSHDFVKGLGDNWFY